MKHLLQHAAVIPLLVMMMQISAVCFYHFYSIEWGVEATASFSSLVFFGMTSAYSVLNFKNGYYET